MKNENSLVPDDHYFDSDCEVLQNELTCLEKVGVSIAVIHVISTVITALE